MSTFRVLAVSNSVLQVIKTGRGLPTPTLLFVADSKKEVRGRLPTCLADLDPHVTTIRIIEHYRRCRRCHEAQLQNPQADQVCNHGGGTLRKTTDLDIQKLKARLPAAA